MNTRNVTRFEVIDHTACSTCDGTGFYHTPVDTNDGQPVSFSSQCNQCHGLGIPGRSVVFWDGNKEVELDLQDGGKTLKVFIHERNEG